MPRIARKDSKSSFYYVMVQGINKEYIFDTDFNIKINGEWNRPHFHSQKNHKHLEKNVKN